MCNGNRLIFSTPRQDADVTSCCIIKLFNHKVELIRMWKHEVQSEAVGSQWKCVCWPRCGSRWSGGGAGSWPQPWPEAGGVSQCKQQCDFTRMDLLCLQAMCLSSINPSHWYHSNKLNKSPSFKCLESTVVWIKCLIVFQIYYYGQRSVLEQLFPILDSKFEWFLCPKWW